MQGNRVRAIMAFILLLGFVGCKKQPSIRKVEVDKTTTTATRYMHAD